MNIQQQLTRIGRVAKAAIEQVKYMPSRREVWNAILSWLTRGWRWTRNQSRTVVLALKSFWSIVMQFCRRRSLVGEILALQLVSAVVVGMFAFGSVWWISGSMVEDNMRTWGEQWISKLDELGMPLYISEDSEKFIRIENYVDQFPEISSVRYYSATGYPVFTDLPHQTNADVPLLEPGALLDLVNAPQTESGYLMEQVHERLPLMRISKPIWIESMRSDGLLDFDLYDENAVNKTLVGFVELALDFTSYQGQLSRNILLGGLGSLVALLFLTIVSWYIYRRALLPLSRLQGSLEELAKGHTNFNVQATGHREIVAIADALNTTVLALDERDKKLWQLANHDPLTGLINRHRFSELFNEELDRVAVDGTSSALLFIDLDQFKYVNDTVGHAAGDRLLKNVALRLKNTAGEIGIVSRFGGDEFLVLLSNVSKENVERICRELIQEMREYRFVEKRASFAVSCSIGVTLFDGSHCTPTDLLAQADLACHHAKAQGRNRIHFFEASGSEMSQMVAELSWSERIKTALRENLFVLRYQPIVDIHTGEAVFHEALIRMQNTPDKLILPAAFLPAASRFGLMTEIDEWVLRNALEELGAFRAQFGDVRLTLNVSGSFFESQSFTRCIEDGLRSNGIPLDAVVMEITEQVAVASVGGANKRIAELANKGLKFAIDDFGAGYSSYNYLKTLPVDYIKIDGGFIKELARDEVDQAIVNSISQIARATGKKTVAEHVQNYDTLEILRKLGVDYAQGYFLGKPSASLRRTPVSVRASTETTGKRRTA